MLSLQQFCSRRVVGSISSIKFLVTNQRSNEVLIFRLSGQRLLAASIAAYFILASFGPSIVLACEGGGEEEKGIVYNELPKDYGEVTVNTTAEGKSGFTNGPFFSAKILAMRMIPVIGNGFTLGTKFNSCTGELGIGVHCERSILFKPTEKRAYESEVELELEDNSFFQERHKGTDIVRGKGK